MKTPQLAKLLLLTFVLLAGDSYAQEMFTIRGKIELASKSKNLYLEGDTIPIKSDGTFYHSGTLEEAKRVYLRTDSSHLYVFWLDHGEYVFDLNEVPGKTTMLKGTLRSGPIDAKVFDDFDKQTYLGFKDYFPKDIPVQTVGLQKRVVAKYIDSIFKHYPNIKSLPAIVSTAYMFVGDSATKSFIGRLEPKMRESESIQRLYQELSRSEKVAKELFFEDFSMQTTEGKEFKLSSVKNKKVILIDFWASSCGPCRAEHPTLINMYEKFAGKGLEIVSVSLDENVEAWTKAINQDKIESFVNVADLKGWNSELIKSYFINVIPFRFLLDGNRKIIEVFRGPQLPSEALILKYL